jgi:alanine racemase
LSGEDGLRSVSKQIAPYVDLLGVASIDEALALRAAGVTTPILLMEGVFAASELPDASRENFHVVLHSKEQLQWINNFSGKLHLSAPSTASLYRKTRTHYFAFCLRR